MQLRIGHGAGFKPTVKHFARTFHGLAAFRAGYGESIDDVSVDIGTVKIRLFDFFRPRGVDVELRHFRPGIFQYIFGNRRDRFGMDFFPASFVVAADQTMQILQPSNAFPVPARA